MYKRTYIHAFSRQSNLFLLYFVCFACLYPSSAASYHLQSLLCFVVKEKSQKLLNKYKVCLALHYISSLKSNCMSIWHIHISCGACVACGMLLAERWTWTCTTFLCGISCISCASAFVFLQYCCPSSSASLPLLLSLAPPPAAHVVIAIWDCKLNSAQLPVCHKFSGSAACCKLLLLLLLLQLLLLQIACSLLNTTGHSSSLPLSPSLVLPSLSLALGDSQSTGLT